MLRHPLARLLVLAILVSASGIGASAEPARLFATEVISGLTRPLAFVADPSDPRVHYVVQQDGRIRTIVNGAVRETDLLDLREVVRSGGEQGLLGLALPDDYAVTGHAFVNFTDARGDTVVARFTRTEGDRLALDPASRLDLQWSDGQRVIAQPFTNHNGGTLRFGPDGMLYIGMGDGGSGNDPQHNAQSPGTLLGKMLRIDVRVPADDARGFRIPDDNPFLPGRDAPVEARPEIWSFGLRNPWKFGFDDPRLGGTGAMLIADVGQSAREEINYEPPDAGGRNYGWRLREGTLPGGAGTSRPPAYLPLVDPIHEYPRTVGQSITGGQVYRGRALGPSHFGRYFFGDFVAGRLFSLLLVVDEATGEASAADVREHTEELGGAGAIGNISAIEADAFGELYVLDFRGGRVLRLDVSPEGGDDEFDPAPGPWSRYRRD